MKRKRKKGVQLGFNEELDDQQKRRGSSSEREEKRVRSRVKKEEWSMKVRKKPKSAGTSGMIKQEERVCTSQWER